MLTIRLVIHSDQGSYLVEENTVTVTPRSILSRSPSPDLYPGSPQDVLSWLAYMPQQIKFGVRGKTAYFIDVKGKQHKGTIVEFRPST